MLLLDLPEAEEIANLAITSRGSDVLDVNSCVGRHDVGWLVGSCGVVECSNIQDQG